MGPSRFDLTKLLVEKGAKLETRTHSGSNVLMSACENEDADPIVIRFLLNRNININYRRRAQSAKWYIISHLAKAVVICDKAGPFPSVRNVLEEHCGRD
jgi:ankyrin repeat protein